ncbi:MAG TPA: tetratricopeptide repeat protein [Candidatus Brocadiales bacterium]|nr:tetratricopeptide repeat protein [Candidatus Brocadiales bacterium]
MKRHISNFLAGALIATLIAVQSVVGETKVEEPSDAEAYNNRAVAYYYKGEYDKAREDVHKAQDLGYHVNPGSLDALRKASGRQR